MLSGTEIDIALAKIIIDVTTIYLKIFNATL